MRSRIENDWIIIEADANGGELKSIWNKGNKLEYLWQGDPAVWGRQSPILFPNAGQVKDNTVLIGQREYAGIKHGFARDMQFELTGKTKDSLTYLLKENSESLTFYPYSFSLELCYRLEGPAVICSYHLTNKNTVPLPFGIGGHPAFNCPLEPGAEDYTDYEVVLDSPCTATERLCDSDGFLSGETRPAFPGQQRIAMENGLFDRDSFLMENLSSPTVAFRSKKTSHGVTMNRESFPYFLIWSVPGDIPFLCLEPWQALPDRADSDHNFLTKPGNLTLKAGQEYRAAYTLEIY